MVSLRTAISFAFLDRYATLVITVAASMVLARLLTPAEVGVWSVTMMLLAYASTMRDLGTGQYMVQAQDLTRERIQAVWAVQLGVGASLAVLLLVASGPVADFYGEPEMRSMMRVVALNYAINPFGSLTHAWLVREMRFDLLALIRFLSSAVGTVLAVLLAWNGVGPMSLALGSLCTTLAAAVLSLAFRPAALPWLPSFKESRSVLSFGSSATLSLMLQTAAASTPELLLGKLQSLNAVGLYSRANGLVAMFSRLITDAVGSVAFSWFARHKRDNTPIAGAFLMATSYVCALGWSFCLAIGFLAHPIINLLYGNQWDGAVDLARVLAVATALSIPAALCWAALMACGAVDKVLRATLICGVQTLALVTIGAFFGLLQLAFAMIAVTAIGSIVWLRMSREVLDFQWTEFCAALVKCAIVAICSAIAPAISFLMFGARPPSSFLALSIGLPGAVIGFLAAVMLVGHPLHQEVANFGRKIREGLTGKNA